MSFTYYIDKNLDTSFSFFPASHKAPNSPSSASAMVLKTCSFPSPLSFILIPFIISCRNFNNSLSSGFPYPSPVHSWACSCHVLPQMELIHPLPKVLQGPPYPQLLGRNIQDTSRLDLSTAKSARVPSLKSDPLLSRYSSPRKATGPLWHHCPHVSKRIKNIFFIGLWCRLNPTIHYYLHNYCSTHDS